MYAIIKTGGKQYKVSQGEQLQVEKLDVEVGGEVTFNVLLCGDGENVQVGTPIVDGCSVKAKVVEHGKGPKVRIFKYKPKKDYRKTQGHRQPFTTIEIVSVG